MKILTDHLTAMTFITTLFLTACSSPAQKVETAEENVIKAEEALEAANKAYIEDMATYRAQTALRIAENERSVAEFKVRISNEKKEAREEYLAKIAALEQKNTDMKKRIEEYQSDGKDNWARFKDEFNKDLEALGDALKDLTTQK